MLDVEQRAEEEHALREVERLRLEMERAAERIQAKDEGVVVRRKKKKDRVKAEDAAMDDGLEKKKKKKKKPKAEELKSHVLVEGTAEASAGILQTGEAKKKKKKKRRAIDLTSETYEAIDAE